ncbi:MAG: VOC family protein [Bacteroidota bacterium]
MGKIISGIQQIGIGIPDLEQAWRWYRLAFGMDVPIFQESAEAPLMFNYTGGKVHSRNAVLALNLQGGGGFEIWQYTSRKTEQAKFDIQLGDYGIYITRIRSKDVEAAYEQFRSKRYDLLNGIVKDPAGDKHFFIRDPYGMIFQVVKGDEWFSKKKYLTGGSDGCIIGVSDIERSRELYSDILGYDKVVYDEKGVFEDFSNLPGGEFEVRRVLLERTKPVQGNFSRLLGGGKIELIKVFGREPRKIFENRFWGDLGFIHLCFDIIGMVALKEECTEKGFPFTVESGDSFEMGETESRFSYIEDPDGTLIEFVETQKIPIIKKIGWYLHLEKRKPGKPLPNWMLRSLSFNKVKD